MIDSQAFKAAELVTTVFHEIGVTYVIGGSLASIIHGPVRSTLDVDIVADLKLEQVDDFIDGLQGAFYLDENMIKEAILHKSSFNLIHLESMVKVDIFIPKNRPFDQQQLQRRVFKPVRAGSDEKLWFLSAEDIVLAKLDWYRLGGEVSERQWRDILGVLKTQADNVDRDYLQEWASQLRVLDLLLRAFEEIE